MQAQAKSKILNKRELRRLQRIYRSRELKNLRNASVITSPIVTGFPSAVVDKTKIGTNIKSTEAIEYVYQFYGSRGALSPNQRIIFRSEVEKIFPFKKETSKIKFALFSIAISQSTRSFSHLGEVRSLLKGATYQRSIRITLNNNDYNIFKEAHFSQSQIANFINQLNKITFSEDNSLEFIPSLFFSSNSLGAKVPMRYNSRLKYAKEASYRPTSQAIPSSFVVPILMYMCSSLSSK